MVWALFKFQVKAAKYITWAAPALILFVIFYDQKLVHIWRRL